jgi:hypothetical protein
MDAGMRSAIGTCPVGLTVTGHSCELRTVAELRPSRSLADVSVGLDGQDTVPTIAQSPGLRIGRSSSAPVARMNTPHSWRDGAPGTPWVQ